MLSLFWNEKQHRLRTFWRVLIVGSIFGVLLLLTNRFGRLGPTGWSKEVSSLITNLVQLVIVLGLMAFAARYLDKRPFSAYGLRMQNRHWWIDFAAGILISAILIVTFFLIANLLGWASIQDRYVQSGNTAFAVTLAQPLLGILAATISIELFYRGFLISNLSEGFNFLNGVMDALVKRTGDFDIGIGRYRINPTTLMNIKQRLGLYDFTAATDKHQRREEDSNVSNHHRPCLVAQ